MRLGERSNGEGVKERGRILNSNCGDLFYSNT